MVIEVGRPDAVIVSAAGNGGLSDPLRLIYPAQDKADGNSAIGASTSTDKIAAFSTRGDGRQGVASKVRIFAPGENIVSTLPGGRYGLWSGTSMSAPVVAGIAALLRAQNPGLSPAQVHELMENTAVKYRDRADDLQSRWSRVDAYCAVTYNLNCPNP
jgi:subtilisin family serine protease